jgi:hypothetical protein
MTPKEKAKELIDKFGYFTVQETWQNKNYYAIECSLITVDEILNEYWSHDTKRRDWWLYVKLEIEKL